jgi:cell division protein FtsI/penicillin-binding protein 2
MKKNTNWRINLIFILIIACGAAIIVRLFFLQILDRKMYEAQAFGQQVDFNKIVGPRGQIFCENSQETKGAMGSGEVKSFAINKDSWTLSVDPKNISDKTIFAEKISPYIGLTKHLM